MRNILVTGGAGFIGSNFVRYMLEKYPDYRIVVYDKLTYAGRLENLQDVAERFRGRYTFVQGDICDASQVNAVMKEHRIDAVVNFAAESHVDRSLMEPGSFIQTDIYGTYVLLEAAKEHGVERYHQVSSVTGDTPILVRDEETGEVALRPIASLDGEEITRYSVLTMTDEYQVAFRPLRRFIKHPADEVYEITYTGGGRLRATGTHSVFVFDGSRIVTKPVREIQVGDFLVTFVGDIWPEAQPHVFELRRLLRGYSYRGLDDTLKRHQQVLATVQARPARYAELQRALHGQIAGTTVYRIAQTLVEGGYLEKTPGGVYAITEDALNDAWERLDNLWWDAVKRKLHIKRDRIVVTPLLMEVFGLYLAEGHCSHTEAEMAQNGRTVVFTLGREEQAALDKLIRCAREVLGIEPHVKEQESSVQVRYSSYWVHALFRQFGATAETKRLPPWIWTQPKSLIEAFFQGYEGDGTVKADGRRYFTTVNRSLAAELVWLARLHDINCLLSSRTVRQIRGQVPPNITVTRERVFYDLQITAEHYRRSESRSWRTPMARCVPTAVVVEKLGCHQHRGVRISRKPLVGKDKALALAATFENPPEGLMRLLNSPVGVAKVRAIRRVPGTVMVYDVSVPGNERFFGGNVPCLLHNTDEVYGEILEGRATETYPLHTRSPYSASKAGGDLMCLAYYHSFDLPVTITRGSNNIGPYQYPEKVVPLFITNAIDDIPLPLYGDGSQMRDYQYVLDHCEGIDVVLHKGKPGEIYNLGTGVETRNIDMARMILDLLGKPHSLIQPVRDRPGHDRRYALDIRKVQALGWRSRHTFEEALEKTVRWYVENEWWWRPIKSGEFYQDYYRRQYAGRELT